MDPVETKPPTRVEPLPFTTAEDVGLLIVSGEDAMQLLSDVMNPPEPTQSLRELMKGQGMRVR